MKDHGEPIGSQFTHVMLPTVIVLIIAGVSLSVDLTMRSDVFWFQRSGALMGAVAIYIGFHEAGYIYQWDATTKTLDMVTGIWYRWLSLVLGILGALIWAYGDLPFRWTG